MPKLFLLPIEVYHLLRLSPILQSYPIFQFFFTGVILFCAPGEGKGFFSLNFLLSNLLYLYIYCFQNLTLTTCLIQILSDALYFKNKWYHMGKKFRTCCFNTVMLYIQDWVSCVLMDNSNFFFKEKPYYCENKPQWIDGSHRPTFRYKKNIKTMFLSKAIHWLDCQLGRQVYHHPPHSQLNIKMVIRSI